MEVGLSSNDGGGFHRLVMEVWPLTLPNQRQTCRGYQAVKACLSDRALLVKLRIFVLLLIKVITSAIRRTAKATYALYSSLPAVQYFKSEYLIQFNIPKVYDGSEQHGEYVPAIS